MDFGPGGEGAGLVDGFFVRLGCGGIGSGDWGVNNVEGPRLVRQNSFVTMLSFIS